VGSSPTVSIKGGFLPLDPLNLGVLGEIFPPVSIQQKKIKIRFNYKGN
jgi:hypothetical protein